MISVQLKLLLHGVRCPSVVLDDGHAELSDFYYLGTQLLEEGEQVPYGELEHRALYNCGDCKSSLTLSHIVEFNTYNRNVRKRTYAEVE